MSSDEDFNELVAADVRWIDPTLADPDRPPHNKITDAERLWLRQAENLDRWYDELVLIMRQIDSQLTTRKAEATKKYIMCMRKGSSGYQEWLDALADINGWRASAVRFKRSVEDRLTECKRLRRELYTEPDEKIEVIKLRSAIQRHKEELGVGDMEISDADEELWATLA